MLHEVLTRRLKRLKKNTLYKIPDLIIIDGGKGHMNVTSRVMKNLNINIPFVCMSKGINRNSGEEVFHRPNNKSFKINRNLDIMKYLQILRDEAHNFALKSHKKQRSRAINISSLDNIPGIGTLRKKALLTYFGSFESISIATVKELTAVDGISIKLAKLIYNSIHLT